MPKQAKSKICNKGRAKYAPLIKARKQRSPGSSPDSEPTVDVIASGKRVTLWMRWLWAYHCAALELDPKASYKQSMKKAAPLYHKDIEGHKFTDAVLKTRAAAILSD